jgi:hypothetical protein
MRLTSLLIVPVAAAALGFIAGPASAGEITGSGSFTPNHTFMHSHSICQFSGLQDGDDVPGAPAVPGVAPQNWGHDKGEFGATPAERKASGFQPGDSCNGSRGFYVNPPPGPPA